MSAQGEHDVHARSFGLGTWLGLTWQAGNGLLDVNLGTCVCSDQVGQASGELGMTLIDAASTRACYAVELVSIDGAGAHSLCGTDFEAGGRNVGGVTRSRVCQQKSTCQ